MNREHVDVFRSPDQFGYGIRFGVEKGDVMYVAKPSEMEQHIPGEVIPSVFDINSNGAQELMDQLWSLGFRPKAIREHENKELMQAKSDHLHDLRVLMGERCAVKLV